MKVNMAMEQPNDLLLDDLEQLLREIDDFNAALSNNKPVDIPQSLENYLHFVAKSGNTVFPWPHVRSLFRTKMMNAIQQFQEPTCQNESFVLDRFDNFRLAAPFTVQRLTELILQPTRHYRKKEKFLRGLEKTVVVVSTIEPRSLINEVEKNGNEGNDIASCEEDSENSVFNRTFTLNRQEMLRASSIDIINQSLQLPLENPDGILLDSVSTSAVTAAVDVIKQNLGMAADVIIPDNVTDPAMSLITPDITIAVSSESIILDPVVSDASTASLVNIDTEADAVSAMECESSTVADPASLVQCVSEQDLVSTAINQADTETLPQPESVLEGVSSTLVTIDGVELPIRIDSVETVDCEPEVAAPVGEQTENLFQASDKETELETSNITDTSAISSDSSLEAVSLESGVLADVSTISEKSEDSVIEEETTKCESSSADQPVKSETQEANAAATTTTTNTDTDTNCSTPDAQQCVDNKGNAESDITDELTSSSETETAPAQPPPSETEKVPVVSESEADKPNEEAATPAEADSEANSVNDTKHVENA